MNIVIEIERGCFNACYVDDSPSSDGCTVLILDRDGDEEQPTITLTEPEPWCALMDRQETEPKVLRKILKALGITK